MINVIALILSFIGAIQNIRIRISGFVLWLISNTLWIYIDFDARLYEQGITFIMYSVLSSYGLYRWIKLGEKWF